MLALDLKAAVVLLNGLLDFAGIPPVRFPVYPVSQQLAEKLHAYTLPRAQENTRVKDFVDLVVISACERVSGEELLRAVEATFEARGVHPLPAGLPRPPAASPA